MSEFDAGYRFARMEDRLNAVELALANVSAGHCGSDCPCRHSHEAEAPVAAPVDPSPALDEIAEATVEAVTIIAEAGEAVAEALEEAHEDAEQEASEDHEIEELKEAVEDLTEVVENAVSEDTEEGETADQVGFHLSDKKADRPPQREHVLHRRVR